MLLRRVATWTCVAWNAPPEPFCDSLFSGLSHFRRLPCFELLDGHEVTVCNDHVDDVDELALRLAGCETLVLIRERTRIGAELLERLPDLKLISQRSVYPHIDVAACTRLGTVVSSDLHAGTPSYATAELTWALVLATARRLPQQMTSLRAGDWQAGVGTTLKGKTLGIVGYGWIGTIVAGYGRAFGMQVLASGGPGSAQRAGEDGIVFAANQRSLFAASDVVSLHVRLLPSTRGMVTAADLAAMSPAAILVNTSRSALIEAGALVDALRSGRPGAAALDVFDTEPLYDTTDPLLTMDNVVCTPHIGYVTEEEWDLQFSDVFHQINAFADGNPTNVINPEVVARHRPSTSSG